ncbi:MAG: alpha/beta hydrolase [Bdellovibrionales bacterium]
MHKRIGQLNCLTRPGSSDGFHVVLLHGFGADAQDLAPLSQVLDPEESWNFTFPEAPLEVPIGPMWTGRGWFPISLRELEAGVDFTKIRPPGLDLSRKLLQELVFELNPTRLVVGGFSQGAMVATDYAMENPDDWQGLIIYSGVLLDQPGWSTKAKALKGKKILQSHGSSDAVLPISAADQLSKLLRGAGTEHQFIQFGGGHEIPMPVLQKTREFLSAIVE